MNDEQLLRYSRQIMLPQVDVAGQQRLLDSTVLLMGVGGLGSPIAMYLAAAGIGHLVLVDHDRVDLSNLQRQIIHSTDHIGEPKVASAAYRLRALNPEARIHTIGHKLEGDALHRQIAAADVVVDGTDNFATRFAINAACYAERKPLVSGAVVRMEGQVTVFDPREASGPCYRCLYPDEGGEMQTCSENGILAPIAGIIGSIQATETIKVLLGLGDTLVGRLLLLDAMTMEWRTVRLKRDPACAVCGTR